MTPTRGRRAAAGLVVAAALALSGCGAQDEPAATTGDDLRLVHEQPETDEDAAARDALRDSGFLADLVTAVDDGYELPEQVDVRLAAGEADPYYDPEAREIVLQYAFVTEVEALLAEHGAEDPAGATLDVAAFVLLHEVGHAFVDVLDLPVVGREEDAVDGLATVLLDELAEDGTAVAVSAAQWFVALSDAEGELIEDSAFADEHSLDLQRYYAVLCLAAGLDEDLYAAVEESEELDAERLESCPADAEQQMSSWDRLLEPHRA